MKTSSKYSGRKLKKPSIKQNFTQVPNEFILNPNISDRDLRLLQYIIMNRNGFTIKTKDCMKYLSRTKKPILDAFDGLTALGILKVTDDIIEVLIPDEMKEYKLGYLKEEQNSTTKVEKTIPSESVKVLLEGKENYTIEVEKTLPESKGNSTKRVENYFKKSLEDVDNVNVTDATILYNTCVLPVPDKVGGTEQTHSNHNTKENTGIKLDLECDEFQSQASPSVLAPSHHTPMGDDENDGDKSSLPISDANTVIISNEESKLPIVEDITQTIIDEEQLPIEPDSRFAEQLEIYTNSKYFLPKNYYKVKNLYNDYAKQYPNKYMPIMDFERVLVYLMNVTVGKMIDMRGINYCLMYSNEIKHRFKDIFQIRQEMTEYPNDTIVILKESELKE